MDHDRHVFQKLLAIVQPDFSATTWEAFRRFAVDGQPAAAGRRGNGIVRECSNSSQSEGAQEVTRRSRRSLDVIFHFRGRLSTVADFLFLVVD